MVTDTTLPIEGVESSISFLQASYQRTLDLFGRTSNFQFHLPYANGTTDGLVEGEYGCCRSMSPMFEELPACLCHRPESLTMSVLRRNSLNFFSLVVVWFT